MKKQLQLFYCIGTMLLLQNCTGMNDSGSDATGPDAMPVFYEVNSFVSGETPAIQTEVRYFTNRNFVGAIIDGYNANKIIMSLDAALALAAIQLELVEEGVGLKVFDAYRPQQAVDHFVRWAEDLDDTVNREAYYPNVDKADLFDQGYIAARSGHSRGSTIDLTLIDLETGAELDMGSSWDFFDPISWPTSLDVSLPQKTNRETLREIMMRYGFNPLAEEWWHFTLENEPYPDTYFNFPID